MKEFLMSKRGFPRYEKNPSIPSEVSGRSKFKFLQGVKDRYMVVASTKDGEVITESCKPTGFYTVDYVDKEKFVKLFLSGVKAFAGLSSAGIKVFEVLYQVVQESHSTDKITINYYEASKIVTMSEPTYHRGMKELLTKQFIFESTIMNQYFINIDYMFNGDRLAFVKEYHLKGKQNKQSALEQEELGRQLSSDANGESINTGRGSYDGS